MKFYFRRDDLPPMRAFNGLELLYDGQFFIIEQLLTDLTASQFCHRPSPCKLD
jgi:hypothetical protein